MLSTMREKTKVVMFILLAAFVGWLIFDVGMGGTGQGGLMQSQDIGSVNGKPIRQQQWLEAYRVASEQARLQNPGATFSREEQQELENQAFEGLVQAELLREEYRRRGIVIAPSEIVDLVRRLPPPEIQQSPDFQTDGQFDPAKYERFITSNNAQAEQVRLAMEARYAEELPRYKLLQAVTADVFVSDAKLWQLYRDTHESLTVRALIIRAQGDVPDTAATVGDEEARRYFDQHENEFRRPARAVLSFVALSKLATTVDSIAMHQRLIALRDSITRGQVTFENAARVTSSDSASAANGGSLGTFGRGQMAGPFDRAVFSLPVGRLSDVVYTTFGAHLIRVDSRTGDSASASHILLPYGRYGERLDSLEARADSLDRIAGDQSDGRLLDSVSRRMDLPIQSGVPIYQGVPLTLGRYRIPDVGVWTFLDGRVGATSPVVETNGAYYIFRIDSLTEAGVPPFESVQREVRVAAMMARKREVMQRMGRDAEQRLTAGRTMEEVAQQVGGRVQNIGPFVRTSTVPVLGTATQAVGTAFRLRVGERSGLLSNDEAVFFIQPSRRVAADSAAWLAQRDQQKAQIIQLARRARAQMYIEGLRRAARVRDNREELYRRNAALADSTGT